VLASSSALASSAASTIARGSKRPEPRSVAAAGGGAGSARGSSSGQLPSARRYAATWIALKKIAHSVCPAAVTASAAAAPCGTIPSQPVSVSYEPVNSSSPPRITKMKAASSTA
jgi:hypothetical protein